MLTWGHFPDQVTYTPYFVFDTASHVVKWPQIYYVAEVDFEPLPGLPPDPEC